MIRTLILSILLFFLNNQSHAQNYYHKIFSVSKAQLDTTRICTGIQRSYNTLTRLSKDHPHDTLLAYYTAFAYLRHLDCAPWSDTTLRKSNLAEAQLLIDQAIKRGVDSSEILALQLFREGLKYTLKKSRKAQRSFEKSYQNALLDAPENPRIKLIYLWYHLRIQEYDPSRKEELMTVLRSAESLLDTEKQSGKQGINWGATWLTDFKRNLGI